MNKADFMTSLDSGLQALDSEERKDILADYETHFNEGMAEGKTEEEIVNGLGDVDTIAHSYLNNIEQPQDDYEDELVDEEEVETEAEIVSEAQQESVKEAEPVFVPYDKQPRSGLAQVFIMLGLIFFNLTFVLGPFIAIWSVWFSLIVSGGALVFESVRIVIFSSMGTYNAAGLSDITMFAQIGFYLTFGLFLILVSLKFGAFLGELTKKYLNWNSRIVKGV